MSDTPCPLCGQSLETASMESAGAFNVPDLLAVHDDMKAAEERVRQLTAELEQAREALPQWIPVKEALPPQNERVWFCVNGHPAMSATYMHNGEWVGGWGRVTYWMPILRGPEKP